MRTSLFIIVIAFVVLAGCEPIGDPWTGKNEMQKERNRSDQLQAQLRERLERGQTDR